MKEKKHKKVRLYFEVFIDEEVPEDWLESDIFNRFKWGTWCASNLLDTLKGVQEEQDCECICDRVQLVRTEDIPEEII